MKSLTLLAALLAAAPARAFDSYTFALSWEPAFCETKSSAPECESGNADRFDATHLALHGLWPDPGNGYCGVDAKTRALDRASTWCQLPEPALSDGTRDALASVMPGASSCLDHHEWIKHGTCSGLEADGYFALAAALVRKVAQTAFGRYLSAHAGETANRESALSAFEQEFGAGSRDKIVLNCADVHGSPALLEVRLRLSPNIAAASELGARMMPAGAAGNCPDSFLLDSFPAR